MLIVTMPVLFVIMFTTIVIILVPIVIIPFPIVIGCMQTGIRITLIVIHPALYRIMCILIGI